VFTDEKINQEMRGWPSDGGDEYPGDGDVLLSENLQDRKMRDGHQREAEARQARIIPELQQMIREDLDKGPAPEVSAASEAAGEKEKEEVLEKERIERWLITDQQEAGKNCNHTRISDAAQTIRKPNGIVRPSPGRA